MNTSTDVGLDEREIELEGIARTASRLGTPKPSTTTTERLLSFVSATIIGAAGTMSIVADPSGFGSTFVLSPLQIAGIALGFGFVMTLLYIGASHFFTSARSTWADDLAQQMFDYYDPVDPAAYKDLQRRVEQAGRFTTLDMATWLRVERSAIEAARAGQLVESDALRRFTQKSMPGSE